MVTVLEDTRGAMVRKRWIFNTIDTARQAALASALSISPITASILLARGVTSEQEARLWLSPHAATGHDPFLLPDMAVAVARLHQAVTSRERICFYGDYDVDGVSATALYATFFCSLGANVSTYLPHRIREGYGVNEAAIRHLAAQQVRLLVTSDCGTTSGVELDTARSLGLDVIVTDHHRTDGQLPPACAVINPQREDSRYPFGGLCSAGLAWKVVYAYGVQYGAGDPEAGLDLVALATIADLVPLSDENRWLVREGLRKVTEGRRIGLRALLQTAGVEGVCTAATVAFRLAPRINAAGRLADAALALQLLTTSSEADAIALARRLDTLNRARQQVEQAVTAEAMEVIDHAAVPAALVVWGDHWPLGVVGIVAARLVERFHRPAVVLSVSPAGVAKGSVRSVPGFDVFEALSSCRDLLDSFGGHPGAAGVTLPVSRLERFRQRFADLASRWGGGTPPPPELHIDAEVVLSEVTVGLVRELERMHPFGAGNPEPTLVVREANVLESRVVGDSHLKLTVRHGRSMPFQSIGFRMGKLAEAGVTPGASVDLAFVPEADRWNGLERIQLRLRDLRASQSVA